MNSAKLWDVRTHLSELFHAALEQVAPEFGDTKVIIERPKQAHHGDYACNIALQIAKPLHRNPREVAADLIKSLPNSSYVEKSEVAGAGFINIFLKPAAKQQVVTTILVQGESYGRNALGHGRKIQVEFVSANPTGPLHVGHGRGAAYGASLANILDACGFAVTREYYVNDAGRQMDILALSTWVRYLELAGVVLPFPANGYQGDYVKQMAGQIYSAHGTRYIHQASALFDNAPDAVTDAEAHLDALIANAKKLLGPDYAYVHDFVLTEQLGDCRNDLSEFGVTFDSWFSEKSLFESGMVERTISLLETKGQVYSQDGAKWFRTTDFGDEKDRVVQRENGQYTYFASDIAYHLNKFERGFDQCINIWGADHHGYVARVKGALTAMGLDADRLNIALVQFAVLYRGGKKASMSTRSGDFITLRELRNEVGNDAARFFYVLRKSDQHMDFDLDLAKSQSNDNPVYYVQYAHARICSVHQQWDGDVNCLATAGVSLIDGKQELGLLQRLMEFPEVVENAAKDYSPHLIAFYLRELASDFHGYYNSTHFLVSEEPVKLARLALVTAVQTVLKNGLGLLGVGAPEKM